MENTDKVKILFCNIGWMENYKGEGVDGDFIKGGGKWNKKNVGYEVCNFLEVGSRVYGYVENVRSEPIKLERITGEKEDKCAELILGVTVVWTACQTGGTVIVGWYNNATVCRSLQKSPIQWREDEKIAHHNISALTSDITLLPLDERNFEIHKKLRGRNMCYANKPEVKNKVSEVIQFIKLYNERSVSQMPDIDISANEGNWRWSIHFYRERNPKLVKAKKDAVFKDKGKLCCEVCNFDFAATYGEWGKRYCEAHHTKQLSKIDGTVNTKLEDLAIVCSNCHRIIHLQDPMLTIEELKEKYKEIAKARGA